MPFFTRLFNRHPHRAAAHRLYVAAAEQSRSVALYERYGVADSFDGRFDSLVLHIFLLLHRLRSQGDEALELGQEIVDVLINDMDRTLRDQGIADVGVAKRVKKMLQAFYGRVGAYDASLAEEGEALAESLARNVYKGKVPSPAQADALARYVRAQYAALEAQPLETYISGEATFAATFPDVAAAQE